jgi:hypothetical protein
VNAAARLAAFALVLAAVFAAAAVAGRALGPFDRSIATHEAEEEMPHGEEPAAADDGAPAPPGEPHDDPEPHEDEPADGAHGDDLAGGAAAVGLAVAAADLAVEPASAVVPGGERNRFEFRVVDGAGNTVTEFDETHERRMHLIVVRRDLTGFQHLHPEQRPDGSWAVPLLLAEPGTYRAFADFSSRGRTGVLAFDLHVPGAYAPAALPPVAEAEAAGPYTVALEPLDVSAGEQATLAFSVTRDGAPAELDPYLGAGGHLVILREGDLGFLHTHPDEHGEAAPGRVSFGTSFPSAGRYRAFLQFSAGGSVRTAAFTVEVGRT